MDNRPNPMGRKRPILETVKNMTIIFFALSAIAALYNFALAARVLIMAIVMLVIYISMNFSKKKKTDNEEKETEESEEGCKIN
ncbi:hypothetical protein [Streptococcus sp. 263_SSPC]|uniref:hypothetical protein n=1 Tax=Streptococcus sp. 263_SSPC TaxID=1579343 RepID=UPI0006615018|nr:hypothetical protein [Streptococcus sp. 263_SSPC]